MIAQIRSWISGATIFVGVTQGDGTADFVGGLTQPDVEIAGVADVEMTGPTELIRHHQGTKPVGQP